MPGRISRKKIATRLADRYQAGQLSRRDLTEAAAYLVTTGASNQYELLIRDVERILAERGVVIADVTAATPVDETIRQAVRQLVPDAKQVLFREHHDPTVLGGLKVELPGQRLDVTIKRKLAMLRSSADQV